jgi:integrase
MRVVRVSGLKEYRVKGKLYRYHRASGTPIDATLTGQALAVEVDRLDQLHTPLLAKPGTLAGLLESYKKSPRFLDLKPRTKSDYAKVMDYLQLLADTPLALIGTGFMAKLRDKAKAKKGTSFANHMLALLSSAFQHGKEYEIVELNPLTGLAKAKMPAERKRPNRPWTPEERRDVIAAAWPQLKLPLLLARTWGLRRGDIVKLPRTAYRNGWLEFRAGKNNALIRLPVRGALKAEMDAAMAEAPKGDTTVLCLNAKGKPWDEDSLSSRLDKFFQECRQKGIMGPKGSIHGLRHSLAAELKAAGYDREQRKMVLGHETDEMADHYSASADVSAQLIDMAERLDKKGKLS